jgi:hypothetical protein
MSVQHFGKWGKLKESYFDENPDDINVAARAIEGFFRINYFIPIVDQAISSLTSIFAQYQGYQKIFGSLFTPNAFVVNR